MRTLGEIQPGQTVGRYEFLVPIAQGGMAAVWAARLKGSRGFSKTVAVKTMLPGISDDPQFEQMFLDEAQICSRIRHPNVVEILDLGEQDDLLYLVMEWVDGEPLNVIRRAASKGNDIPRPVAVKIVADACSGLQAAHELKSEAGELIGLVHRDISPQNILITFDGVVKIVDFGVAKAAGRTVGNTNAGQIKGKPPYMSPEQALGKAIDRRTDLFALGIVLYQLTTGKHPFRGETDAITLQNIVSTRPIIPPRAFDKEYPKPLEAVLMKALDRDADKRYQTAAEFEAALDRVFPPTVPRVRTEDVGKFVTSLLGDRVEERRKALREAIRAADERTESRPFELKRPSLLSNPNSPDSQRQMRLSDPDGPTESLRPSLHSEHSLSGPLQQTPYGTQTPTEPPVPTRSRASLWLVSVLLVAAAVAGGAVWFMRTHVPVHVTNVSAVSRQPAVAAQPATPPSAVAPPASATDAAPVVSSEAIAPSQLAVEKPATRSGRYAWHPGKWPPKAPAWKPAKPARAKPASSAARAKPASSAAPAKPASSAAPAKPAASAALAKPAASGAESAAPAHKPPKNGFVPPPITNPGF